MVNTNKMSAEILREMKNNKIDKEVALDLVRQLNKKDDIAIIGMGAKIRDYDNYDDLWDFMANKKTTVARVDKSRIDLISNNIFKSLIKEAKQYNKGSYFKDIDKFDYELFDIPEDLAEYVDPPIRVMMEVTYRTLEDAGYIGERIKGTDTGVFVGNNFMKDKWFSYLKVCFENSHYDLSTDSFLYSATSAIATRLSHYFDLHGPSYAMDASCASSTIAIYNACQAIKNKQCRSALAGGLYLDMSPVRQYNQLVWIFVHPDDIITRLFDNDPGGAYAGEGAGMLMLKSLEHAIEDGDHIHGIISGESFNNNGANGAYDQSSAEDIKRATINALERTRTKAEDIGLFYTEGWSNKFEEGIELSGVIGGFHNFTDKRQYCAINAVSNFGYLQSCIGTFNIIASLLALRNKQLPPTYHFISPTDVVDFTKSPFYVNDTLMDWECEEGKKRHAMIESYGFGGGNLFFVIDEAPEEETYSHEQREELFVLSARSEYSFRQGITQMIKFLEENAQSDLTDICHAALTQRVHYKNYRLAIVADSKAELTDRLKEYMTSGRTCDGVYYGTSDNDSKKRKVVQKSTGGKELTAIAKEYCAGSDYKFEELFDQIKTGYCRLPGYVFDRKTCWCNVKEKKNRAYYKQRFEL